jgi:hypothetical protein
MQAQAAEYADYARPFRDFEHEEQLVLQRGSS